MSCDEEISESTTVCVDLQESNGDHHYLTESGNNNSNYMSKDLHGTNGHHHHLNKSESTSSSPEPLASQIRVYPIRYFLLFMFISLSMTNAFQWIEYSIIESVITKFYNVDTFMVNCTSVVYMVCYIIGIVPATWLLDNFGLRPCLIVASLGNALGSWIKCLSVNPELFWVSMIGQTVVATSQLFILNIPPLLAATWFPANEVTRTTAYGVFGNQVGIALGFFIPPKLVPAPLDTNHTIADNGTTTLASLLTTTETIVDPNALTARGLRQLFYGVSIITSIIFLLIVAFFESKPPHPPSQAQAYAQTMAGKQSFATSIKSLFTNCNFLLLFFSYGLNTGVFYAISTVLSQMATRAGLGENAVDDAGTMGLIITLAGIAGSVVCGYILGYSKRFKGVTLFVYIFSLLGTIAFAAGLLIKNVWLLFVISAVLGFFMTGYLPIGFEFVAEVSFPQPEGTSAGLLNASAQVFGIIFTFGSSWMIDKVGVMQANIGFIVALVVGAILTMLVQNDLRRQNAHNLNTHPDGRAHMAAHPVPCLT